LKAYNLTYKPYGKHAILIKWPAKIDKNILKDVLNFKNKIVNYNTKVIVDIINTYNSLTVFYNTTIENTYNEISTLKSIYKESIQQKKTKNYCWHIPVCYDENFGVDLQEISKKNNIGIDEIIRLHSDSIYTIFFIGFLPGFLYLGGLDKKLHFPRKPNPRLQVDKGSVGIGSSQTGIYPQDSAGGWNIIGKSPVSFFNVGKNEPCFAKSGDQIQFIPVSLDEYQQIETQAKIGFYEIKKELLND